jgi:hypothetical protein
MQKHLVVSISGHGFGHVAQTAPILNALYKLLPELHLTVRTSVAEAHLRSRITAPYTYLQSTGDIGMVMSSSLNVDIKSSRATYHAFHANWETRVREEADLLKDLHADMVFSNVGYLPLSGAQQAGIANIALCSLNWADIYRHYCAHPKTCTIQDEMIARQILDSYRCADAFLRTTPGMTMRDPLTGIALSNQICIAPIAFIGTRRREELDHKLQLLNQEKLVLVSMGGISHRLPVENWPGITGVRYLVQDNWRVQHPDAIVIESLGMNFNDLLSSCDALLCKPGYGSFVEAACSGIPVIYAGRPDWPESPVLIDWMQTYGISREISHDALIKGNFAAELHEVWTTGKHDAIVPTGAMQAARLIAEKLMQD